jgi:hypothetical protein
MGNIFVAPYNPHTIVAVIDWQFVAALPLFVQARWLRFLLPPARYKTGLWAPQLPKDMADKPADEQAVAKRLQVQAVMAKSYEISVAKAHDASYTALDDVEPLLRQLFTRPATSYHGGIVSLRESLFQVSSSWPSWNEVAGVPCPVSFTPAEAAEHRRVHAKYQEWVDGKDSLKAILGVDNDGWVAPDRDFNAVQATNMKLLNEFVQACGQGESEEAKLA